MAARGTHKSNRERAHAVASIDPGAHRTQRWYRRSATKKALLETRLPIKPRGTCPPPSATVRKRQFLAHAGTPDPSKALGVVNLQSASFLRRTRARYRSFGLPTTMASKCRGLCQKPTGESPYSRAICQLRGLLRSHVSW